MQDDDKSKATQLRDTEVVKSLKKIFDKRSEDRTNQLEAKKQEKAAAASKGGGFRSGEQSDPTQSSSNTRIRGTDRTSDECDKDTMYNIDKRGIRSFQVSKEDQHKYATVIEEEEETSDSDSEISSDSEEHNEAFMLQSGNVKKKTSAHIIRKRREQKTAEQTTAQLDSSEDTQVNPCDEETETQARFVGDVPSKKEKKIKKKKCCHKCHKKLENIVPVDEKQLSHEEEEEDSLSEVNLDVPFDLDFDIEEDFRERLELSLITFQFSDATSSVIDSGDDLQEFRFTWNFLSNNDVYSFKVEEQPTDLNYAKEYPFCLTKMTYKYLAKVPISLEYYVVYDDGMVRLLGKSELYLKKGLQHLGEMQKEILDVNNRDLAMCDPGITKTSFGNLKVEYVFRGDPSLYKAAESSREPTKQPLKLIGTPSKIEKPFWVAQGKDNTEECPDKLEIPEVTDAELQAFEEGLTLVLVRNKALRTTQQQISKELEERISWMHEELKWRLTLQEHAILSGKDPNAIKWRQWRDDTTSNVSYRPLAYQDFIKESKADITITIEEFSFNAYNRIVADDSVAQIYVEYTFLNHPPKDLESPSRPKPDDESSVVFNFTKVFHIDQADEEAQLLAEMIKSNESLEFTIVSEPEDDPRQHQSCVYLGSCQINLFDLIQKHSDVYTDWFTVYDECEEDRDELGKLRITFKGIIAIRALALRVLTPPNFRIMRTSEED